MLDYIIHSLKITVMCQIIQYSTILLQYKIKDMTMNITNQLHTCDKYCSR